MRGRMAFKHHFSLLPWRGARGAEGRHFQGRITFPKFNHYTKSWSSSLTIRHGKYPEEDDPPQHQPKPRKCGRELVLHTTQWSTASCPAVHSKLSHQKNDLRRHQLRPMTKRCDEEDEARLKRPRNLPWPPKSVPSESG
uniref:Uncharacterized protein n=1 Tax=Fagus sylvatica TaxID=28930 RepID=A0A2N9GU72_FAGSY